MLAIVLFFCHYSCWGCESESELVGNEILLAVYRFGGAFGNNIFILIAGYFSVKSGKFSWEKVLKLVLEVTFYNVLLYFVSVIFKVVPFSAKGFITALFPLLFKSGYWFFVTYIILSFSIPIIAKGISAADKKTVELFLVFSFILYVFVENICGRYFEMNNFGYSDLTWMVLVFCLGGYFRLYGAPSILSRKNTVIALALSIFAVLFARAANESNIFGANRILRNIVRILADGSNNGITAITVPVLTFILFKDLKIRYNRIINLIASTTFGIYILHNNLVFKRFMWTEIFKTNDLLNSRLLPVFSILSVLFLFTVCAIIDYLRKQYLEVPLFNTFERNINK